MGKKIRFYPLDVTYKSIGNSPVIYLFGRTSQNKQICVLFDKFLPYFYVIPKQGFELLKELENFKAQDNERIVEIIRVEKVRKRYFGKEIMAYKVFTALPRDVVILREKLKSIKNIMSINECDIQFVKRFMIDYGIIPLTLYEAEGTFEDQKLRVPAFRATKIVQFSTDTYHPRTLSFDIETYTPPYKEIEPEKNPVLMVSLYSDSFKKVYVWKKFDTKLDYVEFVDDEKDLILKFKEAVQSYKPDVLTGYFSDGFDLPYLKTRADKFGLKLDLGLDFSEIKIEKRRVTTAQITGINHLDIFKFIRKIMAGTMDTDTYNLNSVAFELLGQKKEDVDLNTLSEVWDKCPEKLDDFCSYNLADARLCWLLSEKLMHILSEMVKITGLIIFDVNRFGFSQLVEWYLLRQAPVYNEIAPNKPSHDEVLKRRLLTYKGGFVFEPKPGLYPNIVVFDYRSLYPTIIGSHNIGAGTLNCECCRGEAKTAPIEGTSKVWFCQKRKGFIPKLIEDLITRRMKVKELMKNSDNSSTALDARQSSLKLLANSFYGYLGFFAARWYSLECAKATTAYGRFYIQDVISKAQEAGLGVVYSDTDSVFLTLNEHSKEYSYKFAERVNSKLPGLMELEYEGFYPSGIFVSAKMGTAGAKKKYALISEDNHLKIKGFESVRRNWSAIAKESQERVLDIILREHDVNKAADYIKAVIDDLRNKKIPIEKVIIHTQLQKEISEYDARGPHVAVAQRLRNQGVHIAPGSIIRFVVTQGSDIIRNRAKIPEEVKGNEYDSEYYVNNQVVPAVDRIFDVLGYGKESLLENKEQKKLEGFFGS
jgi:DNA polymerase, archaea type